MSLPLSKSKMSAAVALGVVAAATLLVVFNSAGNAHANRAIAGDGRARDAVEATVPMSAPRMAHTATTLADGRVLVVGGFTAPASAARGAELFDNTIGRFLPLPPMVHLRHSHTATRLADGKVLIVGGYVDGGTTTPTAELYDPARKAFVSTGSLRGSRAGHVAVLLSNGNVLIAGGVGPAWSFLATAEIYNPRTGTFSPTGSMTVARESHVGVRLRDGRTLIVGGHRDRRENITLYTSAEVYDETSGTFRRVGDMHTRRHKHDAITLHDGRVLITGGADERDSDGVYDSTELFDPRNDTFTPGPRMTRGRYKHVGSAVVLSNGNVLLAGGAEQAERFDPVRGVLTAVPGAAKLAGQFSAVALTGTGEVLISGGYGKGMGPQSSAWIYRP